MRIFSVLAAAYMPLSAYAIINGGFATIPFLRGVVKVNDDCTGALVGNKCVLTAHHCLARGRRGKVMFPEFKGSVWVESTKTSTIVSSSSPEYSEKRCYDMEIAVLAESHSMGYNLTKAPIQGDVAVAGWGYLGDYTLPKTLQYYKYPAKARLANPQGILVPVLDGVSGIAFQDSGGPLFGCVGSQCFVVGVANGLGEGSTLMKREHRFCDVRSNWAWIKRTLETNCL